MNLEKSVSRAESVFDLDPVVTGSLDKFLNGEFELKEKDGVPLLGGPSMLLHKLDQTNFSSLTELKLSLDHASASRTVLLVGTSGCGKTRTLYTYLYETFGLFFITDAKGNGGSQDVRFLTTRLACKLKDGDHEQNTAKVQFLVCILLVARLKIFKHCQAHGITPKQWLLLQAAWKGFVSKDGEMLPDVCYIQFAHDYRRIDWDRWDEVHSAAEEWLDKLCKELGRMPDILLDEAQVLLDLYMGRDFFVSGSPARERRSVARDFMGALNSPTALQQSHRLVVAGVALPLMSALSEITSGVSKGLVDSPKLISPFGVWDLSSMVEFVKLGIGFVDLAVVEKYVFPLFRGRYRFLATALEIKLASGKTLREACDILKDVIGLPVEEARMRTNFPFGKTMHDSIVQVERYPDLIWRCGKDCKVCGGTEGCPPERMKLIEYLDRSTVLYFLRCEQYFISETEAVSKLIEAGVARTRPEGKGAVIDEFLVLQAYLTHRGGNRWLRKIAMDQIVQTSTETGKGDMYQPLVALCFLDMWKRCSGELSVIFSEVAEDPSCPQWLREELKGSVTLLEGICPLELSRSREAAREKFMEAPEDFPTGGSLLVLDKESGEDIVGRGRHRDGRFVEFGIQAKGVEDPMGDRQLRRACTSKNCSTIFIGFLVVCPRQRGSLKFVCGQNPADPLSFELMITVGEENANLLFSHEEMLRLGYEKPRKKARRTTSF